MKNPVFFIGEELSCLTRQWLQKQQIQYIEQPFFQIDYKKPQWLFFEKIADARKQWVITSIYAAHWLVRFYSQLGLTASDRVYCWSDNQATILAQINVPVIVSSFSKSAELAEKVIDQNEGESVLFLHGDKLHSEIASIFAVSGIPFTEFEVYKNTPIEKLVNGIFDAYLFFSPSGIDNFKASGNFPHPSSIILANENSTARAAWSAFTNRVYLMPQQEELSFIQYSIARWEEENKK